MELEGKLGTWLERQAYRWGNGTHGGAAIWSFLKDFFFSFFFGFFFFFFGLGCLVVIEKSAKLKNGGSKRGGPGCRYKVHDGIIKQHDSFLKTKTKTKTRQNDRIVPIIFILFYIYV